MDCVVGEWSAYGACVPRVGTCGAAGQWECCECSTHCSTRNTGKIRTRQVLQQSRGNGRSCLTMDVVDSAVCDDIPCPTTTAFLLPTRAPTPKPTPSPTTKKPTPRPTPVLGNSQLVHHDALKRWRLFQTRVPRTKRLAKTAV